MDGFDIYLYVAYGLFGLAAAMAIILPLINSLSNPASLAKSAIGIGVLVVFFIIAMMISTGEVNPTYTKFGVDAVMSKRIGGVIILMYLLVGASVVGIVATELHKLFK